jgi:uncharacterized protein YceK
MLRIFVFFMALAILSGCSLFTQGTTPAKPLTPTGKATIILHEWNAQFKDTMTLAIRTAPPLTQVEKETVKTKKAVLAKSKPLIDAYVTLVMNGGVPTQQQEDEIVALINSIGGVLWTQ